MRRLHFNLFALAFALVMLCSCNKAKNISVDNDKLIFAVNGGDKAITVTADGSYDSADCPEWLKAKTNENVLTLTAEANTSGATRDCVIHLTGADGVSVPIAIAQPDKCTHITATPTEVTIPKEGGSATVAIDTDGGNVIAEAGEGFTAQYADGKRTVTAPANEGGTIKGTITLSCDAVKTEVPVTVEGSICKRCNGTGKVKCTKCGGRGAIPDENYGMAGERACKNCGGRGTRGGMQQYDFDKGYPVTIYAPSSDWRKGSGKMNCPECGGAGH